MDAVNKQTGSKALKEAVNRLDKNTPAEQMSPSRKHALSHLISEQVKDFLNNGGEIEFVPSGISARAESQLSKERKYWKDINQKQTTQL